MIKKNFLLSKKIKVIIFVIYTIFVIYFMFFGFSRPQFGTANQEYRFQIVPIGIPLWFPKNLSFDRLKLWIFSLGNLLAFVPFGILIPMIFGIKFYKFILIFLLSITLLEFLQMITYLGSFDINDITINSIGAAIGFLSYKIGNKTKSVPKKIISTALSVIVFTFIMVALGEIF